MTCLIMLFFAVTAVGGDCSSKEVPRRSHWKERPGRCPFLIPGQSCVFPSELVNLLFFSFVRLTPHSSLLRKEPLLQVIEGRMAPETYEAKLEAAGVPSEKPDVKQFLDNMTYDR